MSGHGVAPSLTAQGMPAMQGTSGGCGPVMKLKPVKSPGGNAYAFGNLVAVSPQDFRLNPNGSDIYILVNDHFVLSARPTQDCPPGNIGLSDIQRSWAGISLSPREVVWVTTYDHFSRSQGKSYLGALEAEVSFASRKTTDTPFDQDELAAVFKRSFENQILAPGQPLLLNFKNIPCKLTVRTVSLIDLSMDNNDTDASSLTDPQDRGILIKTTQVDFFKAVGSNLNLKSSTMRAPTNNIIQPGFRFEDMGIGGLDTEFQVILRRIFASRIIPSAIVQSMGINHVRGLLLYGPPGTGKTLMARQIGKMLNAHEPKIVNGPEILNKYVGASEENIRKLFADAEREQREKGDESELHVIIFDELDAVCKQRGSGGGGGTGVGDTVVNQLLTKLDGVEQLSNILVIGMTNRMDMIDEALLRPGRLEVHLEIQLPDERGRVQILNILTKKMRDENRLDADVDIQELSRLTKNFSGAELRGLVGAAQSHATNAYLDGTKFRPEIVNMKVSQSSFLAALDDITPAFGVAEDELGRRMMRGIIVFSQHIQNILADGHLYIQQTRRSDSTRLLPVLVHGPPGSGKTALVARMAIDSGYPFIKLISAEDMIGYSDSQKVQHLDKAFRDAYKSPLSIIVLDSIESMLEWVPIGPRFSNTVLSALKALLCKVPPNNRRLLVFATTSQRSVLVQLELCARFKADIAVPNVNTQEELASVLTKYDAFSDSQQRRVISEIEEATGSKKIGVGIDHILSGIETAKQDEDVSGRFVRYMLGAMAAN